jgi:calcineurin-like phosphoesterase family protein
MKRFFCSDHHLFCKKILKKYGREKVITSLEEMHDLFICKHNEKVKKSDIVYFVGDLSKGGQKATKKVLAKMNGYKILIMGNHDNFKPEDYLKMGFQECHQELKLILKNGEGVLVNHYPYYRKNSKFNHKRYAQFYPKNRGLFLIHGHVHDADMNSNLEINVTLDMNAFLPVSEAEICKKINAKKKQMK